MNFLLRRSGRLHAAVTFALEHGTFHDAVNLFRCELVRERRVRLGSVLLEKLGLQISCHMAINSLLSIALHARVYRRIDLQTVGVKVIRLAVFLKVFVAPSV